MQEIVEGDVVDVYFSNSTKTGLTVIQVPKKSRGDWKLRNHDGSAIIIARDFKFMVKHLNK